MVKFYFLCCGHQLKSMHPTVYLNPIDFNNTKSMYRQSFLTRRMQPKNQQRNIHHPQFLCLYPSLGCKVTHCDNKRSLFSEEAWNFASLWQSTSFLTVAYSPSSLGHSNSSKVASPTLANAYWLSRWYVGRVEFQENVTLLLGHTLGLSLISMILTIETGGNS